jgi:hypothetical protein
LSNTSLAQPAHPVPEEATGDLEHVSTIVPRALRSTRHHRVDYEFLGLLNEDFGIDFYSLNQAFMGVPAAPKRQAISLCEWARKVTTGDTHEAGRALRAWAKKNGKGLYAHELIEAPEVTYEDNEHLRSIRRLS